MSGVTSVSNQTLNEGAGASINLNGSNDTLNMANGDYLGLLAGSGDTINLSDGSIDTLNFTTTSSILLNGSDDTVGGGSDVQVNVNGSNDALFMANGDYVGLLAGNNDTVIINDGKLGSLNGVTNIILSGSNDTVGAGVGTQINVAGSSDALFMANGDYVGLLSGDSGDTVIINSGTIATLNTITNALIEGSNNIVGAGSANQIYSNGSGNTFSMSNGDYVGLYSGNGDVVNVNAGELQTNGYISNLTLNGSNDQFITNINVTGTLNGSNDAVGAASGNQINVNGSGNTLYMANGDYVGIYAGNGNVVNLTGGTLETLGNLSNLNLNGSNDQFITNINVTATVNGSNNAVGAASGNQINVNGSDNTLYMANGDYVGIYAGNGNVVNLTGGTLETLGNLSNLNLNGSNDQIIINMNVSLNVNGSGDNVLGFTGEAISVNGNADVVSAEEGSTVTLNSGDSGDTIDMIGGTIVVGTGVSNITINGTGDVISGPGASLAGPITETVWSHVGPGGTVVFQSITNTPAVVYNPGDIADLVSYFEANPNLSQDQIKTAESDPNYTANLDSYLSTANLYGSPNSLPSNVLAMLDGYSSIYLALTGVSTTEFSEAAYIEQQVGWAEQNYPMPSTIQVEGVTLGIGSILQNLMPALESTNSNTQSLVSEAISLMQQGNAGSSAGNQAPMLDDSTAEMLLAIAETPGFTASTQSSTEVYTPGRSGHWQIIVNGNGTYTQQFKSPPLIQTVLSDLDTYVAPIIDIASVLCLNPEFIALTGLSASVVAGVQVAATAVNLTQAGQDFATGADLQGVLGVIEAVGGALQDIGKAEGLASTSGLLQFGEALSEGGAVAQGIDGVVAGAESGNILAAITSGLGGVAGVAGFANDSMLQQYAAVGAELGATALAAQSGDVLSALDGLVEATSDSGYLGSIVSGVSTIVSGIETEINALYEGFVANELVGTFAGYSTLSGAEMIDISMEQDEPVTIGGLILLDASDQTGPDVNAIVAIVNGYETAPSTPINQLYVVNKGVGVGASSGLSVGIGDDLNQTSAAAAYSAMIQNGVDPTTAQNIENIIAPLALGSAADPNGALQGTAAETYFMDPAHASTIQNFDNNFTTADAQILGAAIINADLTWCENNIQNFTNQLPASAGYPSFDTTTQGQLVELRLNGDLIYSTTPGTLKTEYGTKQQLFYDVDMGNWSAAQVDLQTLYGFTANKGLLTIGQRLVNDNNTHL